MRRDDVFPRIVVGLTTIAAGLIFLLHEFQYLQYWPWALIALGIAHLPHRRWVAGVVWILIGAYVLMPHVSLWRLVGLWPLLISAAGVTLIMQALRATDPRRTFHAVAVMAGNERAVSTQEFAGGDAVAVMGGCVIDLTAAALAPDAVIDVLAFWGGVEIKVPRGWRIENRVTMLLGGLANSTTLAPPDAPRLIIRGAAIMGGIEVRH